MRSTGEVMCIGQAFGAAYAKSQTASFGALPTKGRVFVSAADRDKRAVISPARALLGLGFELLATAGTADVLRRNDVSVNVVRRHSEGPGPHGEPTVVQLIHDGQIDLVVNSPRGTGAHSDGRAVRAAAVSRRVPCLTTIQALVAAVRGIEALRSLVTPRLWSLQELHRLTR